MKKLTAIGGSLLILFVSTAIAQNPLNTYLPAKTKMVISFNPVKLAAKVPAETFRQSIIYREMMKDPSSPVAAILKDLSSTGIELGQDLLFITSEGKTPTSKITHILGKLQSAEKFQSMLLRTGIKQEQIKVYGTDHVMTSQKGVLAWNERVFIFGNKAGYDDTEEVNEYPVDDTTTEAMHKWMEKDRELSEKIMRELAFELLTPRPGNSVSVNSRFTELMTQPGDVKIWNGGSGEMGNSIPLVAGLLNKLSAFTDGIKTATISFEKGKIVLQNNNYPNAELAALMTKHPLSPAGDEMLKNLPKGNLLALLSATYNPHFVNELISKPPFSEAMDSLKNHVSFDVTKLPSVFGDKMMLAVVQNDETSSKLGIDLVLAVPIVDFPAFKSMGNELIKLYDSLRRQDSSGKMKDFKPVIKHTDKLMIFSLSEKTANGFLDGTYTQPAPAWTNEYKGYPMFMQINMREAMRMLLTKAGAKEMKEQEMKILEVFDQVITYGGAFENGSVKSTTEFRLANTNENALKQIFDLINMAAETMKNSDSSEEQD